jgi:hypothetical protein
MRTWLLGAGLVMVTAVGAGAQGTANSCPPGSTTTIGGVVFPDRVRASQDACQMAVDVFQLLSPQLGLALAGGNAVLGSGSTLGGPGHFSLGLRANFFQGDLPDVTSFPTPSTNGRVQYTGANALPASKTFVGFATADAAIGLFGGVPLPLTNVGGIDLLVSATYVPNFGSETSNLRIEPDRNLQLGYGVRVGILKESIVVPGVSFTFLRRDLPTTSMDGSSADVSVSLRDVKVKTSAYRLVASKKLLTFGIAAGIGQDRYDDEANVQGTVQAPPPLGEQTSDVIPLSQKLTRTNYFVDLSANFPLLKLVGEVGQVTGGTIDTFSEFESGRADKPRTYGSVGFRIAY